MKFRYWIFLVILSTLCAACQPNGSAGSAATVSPPAATAPLPEPHHPSLTPALPPAVTPTASPLPTLTLSPAPSSTPGMVVATPGHVKVPILLYHHVLDNPDGGDIYAIRTALFRDEMQRLKDWNYTPLLVSDLARILHQGGNIPIRPVVITFDDGNRDIYENAFPVLKSLGFQATMYVIVKGVDAPTSLTAAMIREMVGAGWEMGSHSYTHPDLIKLDDLQKEVCASRRDLAKIAGTEITSFAYPYGLADSYVTHFVRDCGYTSGVGLGPSADQSLATIYYLNRLTVESQWDMDQFSRNLPWQGP